MPIDPDRDQALLTRLIAMQDQMIEAMLTAPTEETVPFVGTLTDSRPSCRPSDKTPRGAG